MGGAKSPRMFLILYKSHGLLTMRKGVQNYPSSKFLPYEDSATSKASLLDSLS